MNTGDFAAVAITLYAAHHVGDYWVQTDEDARDKSLPGTIGRLTCLHHVVTYLFTQGAFLLVLSLTTGFSGGWWNVLGLTVSGLSHYTADRREHGLVFWLARRLPVSGSLTLGTPRQLWIYAMTRDFSTGPDDPHVKGPQSLDSPTLGTGAWALTQAWNIFFGVFVAALLIAA